MKAEILKLAGVKNEKEFYKKFPTEESFMAKYGKKLQKAVDGIDMSNTGYLKPRPINMPKVDIKLPELTPIDTSTSYDYDPLLKTAAMAVPGVLGGIDKIKQQKKDIAEYEKYGKVSAIVAQAAGTKPQPVKKRYVRPEDALITNLNPLGTGTNYLQAENGTEIQNTYAPDVMYTDLGYEPLEDSTKVKQFKKGGKMKKAEDGNNMKGFDMFSGVLGGLGSMTGSKLGGGTGEIGGAGEIANAVGDLAQFIPGVGPLASLGIKTVGGLIGGLIDAPGQKKLKEAQEKVKQNTDNALIAGQVANFQNANSGFMEDGGWVSNDWQPQVIASFGQHSMKSLLQPPHDAEMLRSGGHLKEDYVPVTEFGLNTGKAEDGGQYAMGGDLQVHRGEAELLSYNPYMPNNGETIMFRGPSHDNGGMPISYGENGVEVEGGEPAQVMKDGGEKDSLVVFGNMYIPDYGANEIGDPKAKGMKFKRYIADLSKQEAKQNKITDKATDLVNKSNTDDPFELLAFNSGQAMLKGSQMNLKNIAEKKQNTAAVQNAILDTAKEHGLDSAELSKQKLAAFGGKFTSAPIAEYGDKINVGGISLNRPIETMYPISLTKGDTELANVIVKPTESIDEIDTNNLNAVKEKAVNKDKKKTDWSGAIQTALSLAAPFVRPKTSNELDPAQLAPELMAMSMNTLEPVQAQTYQPITGQATSYSLQDQLNEITAQSRNAMKLAQGDPSALAAIASQAYQAKNKVLGEQFRMNQGEKQRVAEQNMQILNDAQLKNLALLDQQYTRQAEAKSKTKAQSIEVAKSIADKIAKNKLETKTLRAYENMYPAYSFTSDGTAYKNPFYTTSFNTSGSGKSKGRIQGLPEGWEDLYNASGEFRGTKKVSSRDETSTGKNGKIVKAFKNF